MRVFILLALTIILLSSFMSYKAHHLEVNLKTIDDPRGGVLTSLYNHDGNLIIVSRLRRDTGDFQLIPGHLDLAVRSPKGDSLADIHATLSSPISWQNIASPVAFRAELPGLPPEGSTVEAKYHSHSEGDAQRADCHEGEQ